MTLRETT